MSHEQLSVRRIGIDIDGVIAEQNEYFCAYIRQKYDTSFTTDDITGRNPVVEGCDTDYVTEIKAALRDRGPDLYGEMRPIPGAVEATTRLANAVNTSVVFVTHRGSDSERVTREWLTHHGFVSDELILDAPTDKSKVDIDLDVLIDDAYTVTEAAVNNGLRAILFLRNAKYHRDPAPGVETVADAFEAPTEVEQRQTAAHALSEQWRVIAGRLS
jgi:uncharacterized HAD superfamily protein